MIAVITSHTFGLAVVWFGAGALVGAYARGRIAARAWQKRVALIARYGSHHRV